MSLFVRSVAVATAILLTTCMGLRRSSTSGCDGIAERLTNGDRLEAMVSVHAHALADGRQPGVMDLDVAANVIQCDFEAGSPAASSRKRRAVAELAAFGHFEDFSRALARLGVDLGAIRSAVLKGYPDLFPFLLRNPAWLEMVISNLIGEQPHLGGLTDLRSEPRASLVSIAHAEGAKPCDWKQEAPFSVWSLGQRIIIDGEISLGETLKSVRSNMDPQRWDECGLLWPQNETMLVEPVTGGYDPLPNPPTPGNAYGPNFLREFFSCDAPGCAASFRNILRVSIDHTTLPSQPSKKGYLTSYQLVAGEDGCVGSTLPACPGGTTVRTDVDDGWLEIWQETASRVFLVTHKEVAFDNAVVNGISKALFAHAELDRELAEVACCLKTP
jgi:hypothetical protein